MCIDCVCVPHKWRNDEDGGGVSVRLCVCAGESDDWAMSLGCINRSPLPLHSLSGLNKNCMCVFPLAVEQIPFS